MPCWMHVFDMLLAVLEGHAAFACLHDLCLCPSCRQLQPLSQCCTLCNATDWTAIPWNNNISAILPTFSLALGSDVKVLQPSVIAPGSSLAVVLSSGKLPTICQSEQACDSNVRWQLGSWSSCSKSCGGGSKTRTASCVLVQTGERAQHDSSLL